jgi:hypothetical protein
MKGVEVKLFIGTEFWKTIDCLLGDKIISLIHIVSRPEGETAMIFRKIKDTTNEFALLKAQGRYTDKEWQHQEDTNWWYKKEAKQ